MGNDRYTSCSSADYVTRCSCQANQMCSVCDPASNDKEPTMNRYAGPRDNRTVDENAAAVITLDGTTYHRPTHVSHPTIGQLCRAMLRAGRQELIHYAGASWRDEVAWHVCLAWVESPEATEWQLKATALEYRPRTDPALEAILGDERDEDGNRVMSPAEIVAREGQEVE